MEIKENMSLEYNFIAIEGIIGAGKTTLATLLAKDLNTTLILEQFAENSFLPKFYEDPKRYAFPLELSFLADRYQQMTNYLGTPDLFKPKIISDYFIDKSLIFSQNNLNSDEYSLYLKMFSIIKNSIIKPDLIVYLYLDIEHALKNIKKRGRSYEQNIEEAYLNKIQNGYMEYLNNMKDQRILIIDTLKLDFVKNEKDYQFLKEQISKTYTEGIHRIVP